MEGIGRRKAGVRIEAEDLIKQNGRDAHMSAVRLLRNLNIRLIPGESKAAGEGWILGAISAKWAVLNGKHVKGQAGLDSIQIENQRVVKLAADHGSARTRLLIVVRAQAVDGGRIGNEIKADHIPLLLSLAH